MKLLINAFLFIVCLMCHKDSYATETFLEFHPSSRIGLVVQIPEKFELVEKVLHERYVLKDENNKEFTTMITTELMSFSVPLTAIFDTIFDSYIDDSIGERYITSERLFPSYESKLFHTRYSHNNREYGLAILAITSGEKAAYVQCNGQLENFTDEEEKIGALKTLCEWFLKHVKLVKRTGE